MKYKKSLVALFCSVAISFLFYYQLNDFGRQENGAISAENDRGLSPPAMNHVRVSNLPGPSSDLSVEQWKEKSQKKTRQLVEQLNSTEDPVVEAAGTYLTSRNNLFFDYEEYFSSLNLSDQDVKYLLSTLISLDSLNEHALIYQMIKDPHGLVQKRMSRIDFLRDLVLYTEDKEIESQVIEGFVSFVELDCTACSHRLKQVVAAEKQDIFESITMINPRQALRLFKGQFSKIDDLRFAYYNGLVKSGYSGEEYKRWAAKINS